MEVTHSMATNIVIVGAGFAGVAATKKLAKTFKKDSSVSITLIDKHSYLTYLTELHEVAASRVEPDAIKLDLQRVFARQKNVQLLTDNVVSIDHANKKVIAENNTLEYDYLVLAMGGEPNDFGVPGVKDNAFTLWSMEDAERLRDHIEDVVKRASNEHNVVTRRALLTFVIVGGGFTGVEMVGEINEHFDHLANLYKLDRNEFSAYLVEATPNILQMVTEKEREKTMKYMQKVGIIVSLNDGIQSVDADGVKLASGNRIQTYTTIWTAGVQANSDTKDFGMEKARANRLVANEYMEAKGYDNTYVVGDLVYFEDPTHNSAPTPQIVQAAEQTGETAAENIIASIKGTEKHVYKGKYDGFMVSIGSRYGVAYLMDKFHLSGFLAMLMKHMVNLLYFFTIRSGYYMVKYVQHEFFEVKDRRNIFRGHLARHTNTLWLVPLRIFYGCMWLFEGIKKLYGLSGTTSWFGDTITLPFEWLKDPVSGASESAEAGTEAVKQIFSLNYVYGEQPMQVFEKMPGWFESIMKFMVPNQDVALFMQKMMTIAEILIGLALIAGLFMFIVNAATIGLVMMFSLTGMFYWVNIWFVFAALALMGGSGRTFGLDYYVIPWIQKILGKWWYGKPNHIYSKG